MRFKFRLFFPLSWVFHLSKFFFQSRSSPSWGFLENISDGAKLSGGLFASAFILPSQISLDETWENCHQLESLFLWYNCKKSPHSSFSNLSFYQSFGFWSSCFGLKFFITWKVVFCTNGSFTYSISVFTEHRFDRQLDSNDQGSRIIDHGKWIIELMDHWIDGWLEWWIIGLMDPSNNGPFDERATGLLDQYLNGFLDDWISMSLDRWMKGSLDCWIST